MCCQNLGTNIIDILMLIVTFFAVLVALFGEVFRLKCFGPKLSLSLRDPKCELNTIGENQKAWFYHLKTTNSRKEISHNAVVMLSKIVEICNDESKTLWQGEVPLTWIYPEVYKTYTRDIGPDQIADFFMVTPNQLILRTLFQPNNMKRYWEKACKLKLTVFVKSDEATSTPITYTVAWDGEWSENVTKMEQHVSIF